MAQPVPPIQSESDAATEAYGKAKEALRIAQNNAEQAEARMRKANRELTTPVKPTKET